MDAEFVDGRLAEDGDRTEYGEAWVYESIVGALPGVDVSPWFAVGVQFVAFESAILLLAWYYGLWTGAVAGTVAVVLATVGSALMLRLGDRIRAVDAPAAYRHLLFGSSIEVVLGVFAFVALVTYLFVVDPARAGTPLVEVMLGETPPPAAAFLTLLVLWDVTYRIGTGWWACVVGLWRSLTFSFDRETARELQRVDTLTLGFGLSQVVLVPFVLDRPTLLVAVAGHVLAVVSVSLAGIAVLERRVRAGED
jgi:hypothetical protein